MLVLVLLIHLPFIGTMIGGSVLSVLFHLAGNRNGNSLHTRFARDLMEIVPLNPGVGLVFGALPLATLAIMYMQLIRKPAVAQAGFWPAGLALALLGLLSLYLYRMILSSESTPWTLQVVPGAVAAGSLIAAYLLLISGAGLLLNPEKSLLDLHPLTALLSWNQLAGSLLFLALSFAVTGGAILLLVHQASATRTSEDAYNRFVRKTGTATALSSLMLIPIALVYYLFSLHVAAASTATYVLAAMTVLIALFACLRLYTSLGKEAWRMATPGFMPFILVFLTVIVQDHLGRENVDREATYHLAASGAATIAARAGAPQTASLDRASLIQMGQGVFQKLCSACHRFDQRLVGPALYSALPKYRNEIEELKGYIRSPYKIRPDYPAMPKLGLKEQDIEAVATYLLEELAKQE
jgi:mono/diheme cytochrome c family protein